MAEDSDLARIIGPRWDEYYRVALDRDRPSPRFRWNWAAALVPGWFLYRRFPLLGTFVLLLDATFVFWTIGAIFLPFASMQERLVMASLVLVIPVGKGLIANPLLLGRALRVARDGGPGGVHRLAGGVGLGLVAGLGSFLLGALALRPDDPCPDPRCRAYVAAMRGDLRNLHTLQARFFADSGRYSSSLEAVGFSLTPDITVSIGTASTTGWNATSQWIGALRVCGVFVGSAPPPVGDAADGEVQCD